MKKLLKSKKILLVFMVMLLSCCVAAVAGAASFKSDDYIATGSATVSVVPFDGEIDGASELTSTDNLYKVVFTANAAGADDIESPNAIKAINVVLSYDPAVITPIDTDVLPDYLYEATENPAYAVIDLEPQAGERTKQKYGMTKPQVSEVDGRVVLELTSKYDDDPVSAGDKSFFEFYFQVSDMSKLNATSIMIETDRGEDSILDKLSNFAEFCERRGNFTISDTLTAAPEGYANNVKFSIDPDEINAADEDKYYPTYLLDFGWNVPAGSGFADSAPVAVQAESKVGEGGGIVITKITDPNPSYIQDADDYSYTLNVYDSDEEYLFDVENVEEDMQIELSDGLTEGEEYYVQIVAGGTEGELYGPVEAGGESLISASASSDLELTYGYDAGDAEITVTFKNHTASSITVEDIALEDGASFSIEDDSLLVPAYGEAELTVLFDTEQNVGTYTDELTFAYDEYNGSVSLSATVKKADLWLKASAQTLAYGGEGKFSELLIDNAVQAYKDEGFDYPENRITVSGVELNVILDNDTYYIVPEVEDLKLTAGGNNVTKNYNVYVTEGSKNTLTVTPYQPVIVVGNSSMYYDGEAVAVSDLALSYKDGKGAAEFSVEWNGGSAPVNAGNDYLFTASAAEVKDAEKWFSKAVIEADFDIKALPIIITAQNQTITYGESIEPGISMVTIDKTIPDSLADVTLTVEGTAIKPSAAVIKKGDVDVTANYDIAYSNGVLTVNKAAASITVAPAANIVYDGAAVSVGTSVGTDISYVYSGDNGEISVKWYDADGNAIAAPSAAGSYQVGISAGEGTNYNAVEEVKAAFTIAQRVVEVAWSSPNSFEYNGSEQTFEATINNVLPGDVVELTFDGSKATDVGNYTATVTGLTGAAAGNYTITGAANLTSIWQITAKELDVDDDITVILDPTSFTYTGSVQQPTVTVKYGEKDITDQVTVTIGENKDAGTYSVTVTAKAGVNYTFEGSKTAEYTINPAATPVITPIVLEAAYSQTNYSKEFDLFQLATLINPEINGGIGYQIEDEPAFTGVSADVARSGKFTVKYTSNGSGAVGESVSLTVTYGTQNYGEITVPVTLTLIDKISVNLEGSVSVDGKVYDGNAIAAPSVDVTASEGNPAIVKFWQVKDGETWTNLEGNPVNAGTYRYAAQVSADDSLYTSELKVLSNEVVISKAAVTVTAKDAAITYGDAPANNGCDVTGLVSGDSLNGTVTYTYSYDQYDNVGEYTITPAGLSNNNYNVTFVAGKLTVDKRPISVTAENQSVTYGNSIKTDADRYEVSGLADGHTAEVTLTCDTNKDVGTYPDAIVPSVVIKDAQSNDVTKNYAITAENGDLKVTQKWIYGVELTLSQDTFVYNGSVQQPQVTVKYEDVDLTELLNAANLIEIETGADVYTYQVAVHGNANVGNYFLTPSATATAYYKITPAPAPSIDTIQLEAAYSQVGFESAHDLFDLVSDLKPLGTTSVGFAVQDDPAFAGVSADVNPNGTFTVKYNSDGTGAVDESVSATVTFTTQNYGKITVPVTLTLINKIAVELNGSVSVAGKVYDGSAIAAPAVDVTASEGTPAIVKFWQVKNGETWTKIDGNPVNAGTYRYAAQVSEDDALYSSELKVLSNEVVISKAAVTVTAKDAVITYGAAAANNGYTVTGLVSGDSLSGTASYTYGTYTAGSNVGEYKIAVSGLTASSNYTVTFVEGKLTVNALKVVIDWADDVELEYTGSEQTITAAITNILNSDAVALVISGNKATNAGNYTATVTGLSGAKAGNYTITGVTNLTQAWSIEPADADMTVTVSGYTATDEIDEAIGQILTASVSGDKGQITYQWYRNGAAISGATSATYALKAADLGTSITVKVTSTGNYVGSETSAALAISATNPAAVSDLDLTADEESITATWSVPANGGSAITKYIVTLTDADGEVVETAEVTDTEYTFEDLDEETEYTVTVVAVNAIGESEAVSETIETEDGTPSKIEADLDIDSKGDTTYADVNNGKKHVSITDKDMDALLDEVKDEDSEHVVIDADNSESLSLPSGAAQDLAKAGVDLTIELDEGDVYLSNAALKELGKGKLMVELTASNGNCHGNLGELYDVEITVGGKAVQLINPICIEIPHNSGTYTIAQNEDGSIRKDAIWNEGIMNVPVTGNAEFHIYNNQKFFVDMPGNHAWAQEYVDFVTARGLFNGMSATEFGPGTTITREMFITVLYRLAGAPAVYGTCTFSDAVADKYYEPALIWAVENNIINEKSGKFGVGVNLTRQDMVTWLHNFAVADGLNTLVTSDLSFMAYSDVSSVADYAMLPFQWAVDNGIVNGRTTTTLVPEGTSTRAEVATILTRYLTLEFEMTVHEL